MQPGQHIPDAPVEVSQIAACLEDAVETLLVNGMLLAEADLAALYDEPHGLSVCNGAIAIHCIHRVKELVADLVGLVEILDELVEDGTDLAIVNLDSGEAGYEIQPCPRGVQS